MNWQKKPIDRMELLNLLGILYAQTAAGYGRVGLQTLMEKHSKPTVRAKRTSLTKAILESGLLFREGKAGYTKYKWNLKEFGPPSLLIADMLITKAEMILRRDKKATRLRKKQYEKEV